MPVEFEVRSERTRELARKWLINSGESDSIDYYLPPAKSVISCSKEDTHGIYEPAGELRFLRVDLVDEEKGTQQAIPVSQKHEFSGPRLLVISSELHDEVIAVSHKKGQRKKIEEPTSKKILVPA
jgi:hypothetical protein